MFPQGWPQELSYSGQSPAKIEIVYDDNLAIDYMISHPKEVLKHAFEYVEHMDVSWEPKWTTLYTLSFVLITIICSETIQGKVQ